MRIVSVVGARPQFVKLSAIHDALIDNAEHVIIHTGQHYDPLLSEAIFEELEIPQPAHNLSVGSANHGVQTGTMMLKLEPLLENLKPDWVVVYGDTNSTIAAALTASKLHLPLAHLEAGLRSFNRKMPEEINRVLTDHASDLCLAASSLALKNLSAEGLSDRSIYVGDVMVDVLYKTLKRTGIPLDRSLRKQEDVILATIHRQENTEDLINLKAILNSLNTLPLPVTLYAHPRLSNRFAKFEIKPEDFGNISFAEPVSYTFLIAKLAHAAGIVTDSGGLQKEAYLVGTPCVTLRQETEWPETIELGWNRLFQPGETGISEFLLGSQPRKFGEAPYGRGDAANQAAAALLSWSSAS